MTSEIRANTLKNRVGLGTISFTNTGPVVSGIVTISNSTAAGVKLEDNAGVGGSLKITTPSGYVSIGAGNATFAHLQTDRGIYYFNKRISVDEGIISSYDEDLVLQSPMNTNRITINKTTGLVSIINDLDVDGHTNLDNVSIAGVSTFSGNLDANGVVYVRQNASPTIYLTSNSTTGSGRLFFGDPDSDLVGRLSYVHNGDYFSFYAGYGERFRIAGNGDITATSIDNFATGPTLKLFHNSGSPAANDVVSRISMFGDDAAGNETEYGRIETVIDSTTDSQETGHINFGTRGLGSFANVFRIKRRSTASAPSYTADDADGVILDVYNTGNPYPRYMNFIAKSAGNTDSNIGFWTEAVGGSPTEKLRITSDGKIGIGEDDPDGNYLLIRAASTFQTAKGHIMLTGDSATNGQGPQIVFSESGSGSNFAGAYIGHVRAGSNSIGDLVFGTRAISGDANTVPTERLRITNTGRLKINHTQSNKLDDTWLSIYDANSDSSAIDPAGISKNYAMISLHNYGTGVPGDSTGIGFGAGSAFNYTKGSIAFARSGSYGTGDLVFLTNNDQDTTMVNDTDEKMRITRDDKVKITGVVETGPKTITGGNNLAIQNFAVKGIWSGSPSIGKSIELISGYDSAVKMAAIGYNLTDVNLGSTYGGDLTFHTQPLYSSPTTPLPVRMRISSKGYVTKPETPAFFATHTGGGNNIIGTLTYNTSGNGYYNNGGHLNVSTGKFTAPVAGIYTFHFHGFFQSGQADAYYEVIFRRTNSNGGGATSLTRQYGYRHIDPSNQYGPSISMHCTCYLTVGQTMEVRTGNLAFHGSNGWYFGGHLVG